MIVIDPPNAAGHGRLGLAARGEDAEDLVAERDAIQVRERHGEVGQRDVGKPLPDAVQRVGLLEGRPAAGAQGVQEGRAGLVVPPFG